MLSSDDGSDDAAPSEIASAKKKREVTGVAKKVGAGMAKFNTDRYALYDPEQENVGDAIDHPHIKFDEYDSYTLFMVADVQTSKLIPQIGVRLHDMHVAIVIESGEFSKKQLNEYWRAEFDANGMTRGLRNPLGHAAKAYKKEGDVDIEGHILKAEDKGWYYLWHRGLHMLGGTGGFERGRLLKTPQF